MEGVAGADKMKLIPAFEKLATVASPRGYIGCSQIGHACDRYIWLNKYGKMKWEVPFRTQRIFERGKLEERRIDDLVIKLWKYGFMFSGAQTEFSNDHLQGSCDGFLYTPDEQPHVFELKTMNDAAFRALKKHGLGKSNAIYWAQCQAYMHLSGIPKTIFLAVNKNDESMYEELIAYDPLEAEGLMAKAQRIDQLSQEPEGIYDENKKPQSCFQCQFHQHCYGDRNE
jgi:hypothetical protein